MGHIDKILAIAKGYIGQEEIQPNLGFKDPVFNAKMIAVGFYRSASWCGFFVMLVLFEAYADALDILKYLKRYCSPSTHQMWLNFKASKEVITGHIPKPGAVCFWAEGDGTNGHVGICNWSDGVKYFTCDEGNTNGAGGREGYRVWENKHQVDLPHSEKGLNYLGCAYMPDAA